MKLADAVTYDDQGDVIPLSERFDRGNEDIRYSLRETDNGRKVAVVDNDILHDIYDGRWTREKEKQAKAAAGNALKKFNRVYVNNVEMAVNSDTRTEYTGSDYTEALWKRSKNKFADEMRFADVMNDVVTATVGWENDGILTHDRTDKFVDFVKGDVLLASGDTKYSARVVVGITDEGRYVLRDITSIKPTDFNYKNIEAPPNYIRDNPRQSVPGASTNISIAPSDGSVKYSLRENDRKYMEAVEHGNTAEAQKLVDAAAKAAGYKNLFYHGAKKGGGFTTFRGWSYFTENKGYAQRYSEAGNANSLYTTYVKMERPFDTRIPEVRELFDEARMEYGMGQLQDTGLPDWTDGYDLSEYIEENDLPYDGIVLDEGGDFVNGKPVSRGLSYVIRDSAQIKSADAVTCDDQGDVIPLSERFDRDNEDIWYSVQDDSDEVRSIKRQIQT